MLDTQCSMSKNLIFLFTHMRKGKSNKYITKFIAKYLPHSCSFVVNTVDLIDFCHKIIILSVEFKSFAEFKLIL